MKNCFLIVLAIAFVIVCSINAVHAQDAVMKGTETPLFKNNTDTTECFVFNQYVVKTIVSTDFNGGDISIYKRPGSINANSACKAKLPFLFTIKSDENIFFGLSGAYLFIDSGTSPEERGLEIYNLNTRKSIFSTTYNGSGEPKLVQGRFVIYDSPSEKKDSLKTCKEAAKWGRNNIGWVQGKKLDLQTMKEVSPGGLRCVYVE